MSRGPSKAVAALLSATEMAIPGLKKEGGESPSLMSIPRMKSDCGLLKSARPGSLSRSSSMTGDDPRQRKKEMVDAELKDAISALRRPNRQLVGAEMAEAAERRTSGSLSQTRSKLAPSMKAKQDVDTNAVPQKRRSPFGCPRPIVSRSRPRRHTTGTATPAQDSRKAPSPGLYPAAPRRPPRLTPP